MSRYISSLSNPKVKEIVQLVSKSKVRKVFGVCVVEGRREVERALACNWELKELWSLEHAAPLQEMPEGVEHYEVSAKVYEKIAYRDATEDVVAVFYRPDSSFASRSKILDSASRVVVVEGIEKPGNLGAIMRTALAAGAGAIILADPALDPFGPNVVRNATGALFELPIFMGSSDQVQQWLHENSFTGYITHMHEDATSIYEVNWAPKSAIILGEESRGLSAAWLEKAYENVLIPMKGKSVDSLNVSVAAAVLLYQCAGSQTK
ncbi:MAG: RNA methyltransferase [Schleiferiaceae bacterium]|nr:RNA methyltransferase [Schleiferiaceae bacterium]